MIKPPLTELEARVDSKYTLVSLAAKRARQIIRQANTEEIQLAKGTKPVSMALEEIAKGEVGYVRTKEGIK